MPLHRSRAGWAMVTMAVCACGDDSIAASASSSSGPLATATETDSLASSGTTGTDTTPGSSSSSGVVFDPAPWVGVHHLETPFLHFGEPGELLGDPVVANLTVEASGQASLTYENCASNTGENFWDWEPVASDAIALRSRDGEPLEFLWHDEVDTLVLRRDSECRLEVERNGAVEDERWFSPGAACWINRCDSPAGEVHVALCEGTPACDGAD